MELCMTPEISIQIANNKDAGPSFSSSAFTSLKSWA